MATAVNRSAAVQPDVWMEFRGVGWEGLQHAKALLGEERTQITYAGGDLLLMSPGPSHEAYAVALNDVIRAVGRAFRVRTRSLGATLYERPEADSAKMADLAFYVANARRIGNRMVKPETDPVPDLVVEVEITRPVTLALKAYAAMGVPEVWHFARTPRKPAALRFLVREGKGWTPASNSLALPMLAAEAVLPLIERTVIMDELDRADLIDAWVRDELRPGRRRR